MSFAAFSTLVAAWLLSAGALATFFVLYPLVLGLAAALVRKRRPPSDGVDETVSLLVVVRNAESFIEDKIRNSLELDYPASRLEIVFCSDGSTDATERIIERHESSRLRLIRSEGHQGKIASLNQAIETCSGALVVLSDADAMLEPDAVRKLCRHFADPDVGGVCGQRVISRDRAALRDAQSGYIHLDSRIKIWESRLGSLTSNDGKLYAIRRELFHPIAPAVSDDLFVALDIVRQHRRFTFEPEARALIRVPARNPSHEIERRRRIVSQSLRGIWIHRAVLNPLRYGAFAPALAVNKILRRMQPFALLGLLASSLLLSFATRFMLPVSLGQVGFYALAACHPLIGSAGAGSAPGKAAALAYYFVLGQLGTMLGVFDFLSGRSVAKWDPVKTDGAACPRS